MNWYYALGQQQNGPVAEDQLHALAKDGVVTGETLVWRDGMANWQPYRTISGAVSAPPPAPPSSAVAPATATTTAAAPNELTEQQVLEREYRVEIGEALNKSWQIFTANAGVTIGACIVLFMVMVGAAMLGGLLGLLIPFVNILINMFLNGVTVGGALMFFVDMHRGAAGQFNRVFSGFGPRFWQLGLGSLVQGLINLALIVPGVVLAVVLGAFSISSLKAGRMPELSAGALGTIALIAAVVFIVVVYVSVLWTFSFLLVIDKGYDFWPAMQLSRRMVSRRWWMTFLFMFVGGIISMLGAFACIVGLLVSVPVFYGMYAYLYDANFRDLAPARRE